MQKTIATYQKPNNDNIVEEYGKRISKILGVDLIKSIEKVSSEKLRLGYDNYPCANKLGNHPLLKTHIVVRGTFSKKRKFIAMKIDVLNESHKHIYTITEIIFQPYSENKNYYDTKSKVTTDSGIKCYSLLCEEDGSSIDTSLRNLKEILIGKTVKVARYENTLMKSKHLYFRKIVDEISNIFVERTKRTVILRKHISPPLKLNRKPYTDCKINCVS